MKKHGCGERENGKTEREESSANPTMLPLPVAHTKARTPPCRAWKARGVFPFFKPFPHRNTFSPAVCKRLRAGERSFSLPKNTLRPEVPPRPGHGSPRRQSFPRHNHPFFPSPHSARRNPAGKLPAADAGRTGTPKACPGEMLPTVPAPSAGKPAAGFPHGGFLRHACRRIRKKAGTARPFPFSATTTHQALFCSAPFSASSSSSFFFASSPASSPLPGFGSGPALRRRFSAAA